MFMSTEDHSSIERLAVHLESGEVVPAIGSRFSLDRAVDAMRQFESGTASGKTLIDVDHRRDRDRTESNMHSAPSRL